MPTPSWLAVDQRGAGEAAVVRRPFDLEHLVGDGAAEPCERLLELRLVVDVARQRVLDPRGNASTIAGSTFSKPCSR